MKPAQRMILNIAMVTGAAVLNACSVTGGTCGGGQRGVARAVMPDTGINSKAAITIGFTQHGTQELSEYVVWVLWPGGTAQPAEMDFRLRVVRADGLTLVDTTGFNYRSGVQSGFLAQDFVRTAGVRNSWYDAFKSDALYLELWHGNGSQPATRIKVPTEEVEVAPELSCG